MVTQEPVNFGHILLFSVAPLPSPDRNVGKFFLFLEERVNN